jgi:hypothetical protein
MTRTEGNVIHISFAIDRFNRVDQAIDELTIHEPLEMLTDLEFFRAREVSMSSCTLEGLITPRTMVPAGDDLSVLSDDIPEATLLVLEDARHFCFDGASIDIIEGQSLDTFDNLLNVDV